MFYTYDQNNSGGSFHYDEDDGIANYVIIEADSADEANARAQRVGVYFDPYYRIDCNCCGTRWDEAYDEGDTFPSIYSKDASIERNYRGPDDGWDSGKIGRMFVGSGEFTTFIHYADGRVVGHGKQN